MKKLNLNEIKVNIYEYDLFETFGIFQKEKKDFLAWLYSIGTTHFINENYDFDKYETTPNACCKNSLEIHKKSNLKYYEGLFVSLEGPTIYPHAYNVSLHEKVEDYTVESLGESSSYYLGVEIPTNIILLENVVGANSYIRSYFLYYKKLA